MPGEVQHVKQVGPIAASVKGDERRQSKVVSAMKASLEKAMEEIGQVRKQLAVLQTNIKQFKHDNVGLRTASYKNWKNQRVGFHSWRMKMYAFKPSSR